MLQQKVKAGAAVLT